MIKVSVFYPNGDGAKFNMDYYRDTHMSLVRSWCGDALKQVAIEQGLGGLTPGSPAPYVAMGHLYFDSIDAMQNTFGRHISEAVADIPNFTNIQPTVQISEVAL